MFNSLKLLLYILSGFNITSISAVICYSCTASLDPKTDKSAQLALRVFLDSAYNLPAVHKFCNMDSSDHEFKTIPTVNCVEKDDECVKISAKSEDVEFVIRGCKSQVYKAKIGIQENLPCQADKSPSLCICKENLCNSGFKIFYSNFIFIILLFIHWIKD